MQHEPANGAGPGPRQDESESSSLRRLAFLLKPYTMRLCIAVVMLIALAMVNMLIPAFLGLLFDKVFPNRDYRLLGLILMGILAVYTARNLLYFGSKFTAVAVGENVCFTLRNRLFETLQRMNLQFYRDNQPGRISSRLMDDSFVIQSFISDDLPALLQASFRFLCLVAIMFTVNYQLAIVSMVVLPFHLIAFYRFRGSIKRASRNAQEQLSNVHGSLIEKFIGAEVIKIFTAQERESAAFHRATNESRVSQIESKKYHVTQKVVSDLLIGVGTVGLLGFGAYQVMARGMMVGQFIMFFSFVGMLYPTVLELMTGLSKLAKSSASIERVFELLEKAQQRQGERIKGTRLREIHGRLEFRNVGFSYGENASVLRDVTFEVPAGQVCAIVGPSGAGKTTLVSLVPQFIQPTAGSVMVDGLNVSQFDLQHLRGAIGVAFQECFLFNSSIRENLQYARPEATLEQIQAVAKKTGAHDFIVEMPDGYDTLLGESGVSLSRGQKQRITLTRAMLKNPLILILDEATASIDTASESQIIPNILEFMRGKTTLMITHRPELLRHADMVVHLVAGEVVYQGPASQFALSSFARTSAYPPVVWPETGGSPEGKPAARRGGRPRGSIARSWAALATLMVGSLCAGVAHAQEAPVEAPAEAPVAAPAPEVEPDAAPGRFLPITDANTPEVEDLVEVVVGRLEAELGYHATDTPVAAEVMPTVQGLRNVRLLARSDADRTHLLRIGYRSFTSQPVHISIYGISVGFDGASRVNPDVDLAEQYVAEARITREERTKALKVGDLSTDTITLSYIEPDRALGMLKSLGYQTIEFRTAGASPGKAQMIEPNKEVDPQSLPIVILTPGSDSVDLVGGAQARGGAFGLTMTPSVASELPNLTSAGAMGRLMVLYHPAHPEQFGQLLDRVRKTIDVPARQILIEAMVLEISETGLSRLGVEWELNPTGGANAFSPARMSSMGQLPIFDARRAEAASLRIGSANLFGEFLFRLEALVRDGEAEILSRPSVLTLDNRQASIRVGEDIPIATSTRGARVGDQIAFSFQYLPVGILLNVRPRVSADAEEVSIQIDGIVSSAVVGEDLELRDSDNTILASAPRIATRRVQTYGRIANNTPFIIGGLISRTDTEQRDRVPFLGDLPLIGALFGSTQTTRVKREVIIVITPYVVPEGQLANRNLPKDDDLFDSYDNRLFRDAYRIRAEDIFDLKFLTESNQLQRLRNLASQVVSQEASLSSVYPFSSFVNGRVPGEEMLVYRQMYEVIKRRAVYEKVNENRLIFFMPDATSEQGFGVRFLWPFLASLTGFEDNRKAENPRNVWAALRGKALRLTFTLREDSQNSRDIMRQPVPEIEIIDCPNSSTWSRLLWEYNQPDEENRQRYTILIRNESDLVRLKRAIVLKHTVDLNDTGQGISLKQFALGRQLLMPSILPDKTYLIDEQTARYFFLTEQYYPAVRRAIDHASEDLLRSLRRPELRQYISNPEELMSTRDWSPAG